MSEKPSSGFQKTNILSWLEQWAYETPEKPVFFTALTENCITYGQLLNQVKNLLDSLEKLGIRPGDRIGLMGVTGAALATASVAAINACVCVPMNPSWTTQEMAEYLKRHRVRALIVPPENSNAHQAALNVGIPTIDMVEVEADGLYVQFNGTPLPQREESRQDGNIAVIMQTSGTTSPAKTVLVPRSGLAEVAFNTFEAMAIGPADRSLNYLPLFHIHALSMNLFGVLSSGGSVVYIPGFTTAQEWLDVFRRFSCTWMTAGPAPLKALCDFVKEDPLLRKPEGLRMFGGGGAPIAPSLYAEIEKIFNIPLLYGWGLTEASGSVTVNPPHGKRKFDSVGLPFGCEIGILDENGTVLPAGERGEVALRSHTLAYYEGETRNSRDWMGTGDEGYLDSEGYLYITGRIKELINKGGMKISPYEVEEQIMRLPEVKETACFAIPHHRLGEDIACVIVAGPTAALSSNSVRDYLFQHLARYKVPSRILFANQIPKGPTGKVQRVKLGAYFHDHLQKDLAASHIPPRTPLEEKIAAIWGRLIENDAVGVQDDFFALGGDSLAASLVVAEIEAEFQYAFPASVILLANTVEKMAKIILEAKSQSATIIPLRTGGTQPPVYVMHYLNGEIMGLEDLFLTIDPDYPLYGICFTHYYKTLQKSNRQSASFREIVSHYADELQNRPGTGPFFLIGHSFGGFVVHELACQLQQRGCEVGFAGILDSRNFRAMPQLPLSRRVRARAIRWYRSAWKWATKTIRNKTILVDRNRRPIPLRHCFSYFRSEFRKWREQPVAAALAQKRERKQIRRFLANVLNEHVSGHYRGRLTFFRAMDNIEDQYGFYFRPEDLFGWKNLADEVEVIRVPGTHEFIVTPPNVDKLGSCLNECLRRVSPDNPSK